MLTPEDLAFDREHLWHPYTSALNPLPSYPVARAAGCELFLQDGRPLIDGMASWWSVIHGYNHPRLNQAVFDQVAQMSHVMFGGITHEPAVRLGQALVRMTPEPLTTVFLADSGSVSVEVALKQALQYWQGRGVKGRYRFAAFRYGYHGDTFGAMSVTDPENGMHGLFAGFLPSNVFLDAPPLGYDMPVELSLITRWREQLAAHRHELAAVIVEPVVQGAGGMRIYNPAYLAHLRSLCDELDLLLIFDEIATGFGRTGRLFAMQHAQVIPDILTVGKALTGGYMTLAATLCTRAVAETVCRSEAGVFMHGPTFMANPLACQVATASLELLSEGRWPEQIQAMEAMMRNLLLPLAEIDSVADTRVLGGIGVVEMRQPMRVAEVQKKLIGRGVWIRPFGKLFYIMPPYVIRPEQLRHLIDSMRAVCTEAAV